MDNKYRILQTFSDFQRMRTTSTKAQFFTPQSRVGLDNMYQDYYYVYDVFWLLLVKKKADNWKTQTRLVIPVN